ncbi:TspO/MBR family protein [Parabacteroides hominis]|jgi:benzodiazapine receptor|uniref:Tryptophan-rich sensory protein n=1 Tax=Parabacteroides hominis TaxID=2763057 RepID=A0ABR7DQY8_9BACT|nr:TspO/MBR family protein [Parabacteroides hominis]MBC5633854.1 tryptophan-rich sensory protein [Parabacteroides hominis]MBD9166515.1 tryptophan-rich sensory protein [Parabacteroides johnsonii]
MRKVVAIIIPVLICFFIGLTASYFQDEAIKMWYPLLSKPKLTPPNVVFPIAWSIIYLCMGISIGIIFLSNSIKKKELIKLFGIQLIFNFTWSILFFYLRNPLLGLIDILILDICVTMYAIKSYPVKKVSSFLFIPYIIWIYFATYLNGYILLNN